MAKIKIRTQFLTLFMIVGIIPLSIVGMLFFMQATSTLTNSSFEHISTIQDIKKEALEEDFNKRINGVHNVINTLEFERLFTDISLYHNMGFSSHTSDGYQSIINSSRDYFASYIERNGLYNMYILSSSDGGIYYNFKEERGLFDSSGLKRVWQKALASEDAVFEDFSAFAPSMNMQSAFFARTIYSESGKKQGVLAFQITSHFMGEVLDSTEGLGVTGESYIVSYEEEKDRYEFRSDMSTMGDGLYNIGL